MKMDYFFKRFDFFVDYVFHKSTDTNGTLLILIVVAYLAALGLLMICGQSLQEKSTYFIGIGVAVVNFVVALWFGAFHKEFFFVALMPVVIVVAVSVAIRVIRQKFFEPAADEEYEA